MMNIKSMAFALSIFLLIPLTSFGQESMVKESLTVDSQILGKQVEYSIYLPAGYQQSNRSYPVLYLLHGFSDDETGWVQFGEVKAISDREMQRLAVTPMIIVMPDAGVSWYINNHDGSVRYEDFFIEEFIPFIDANYRTRPEKEFRAVAGLSMGGYGTMIMATKHSNLFAAAGALSAGISTNEQTINMPEEQWDNVFGIPFGKGLEGEERLTEHYLNNSILHIIKNTPTEQLKSVRYYIDCGDDDFLIKGNMALHAAMIDKEVPHEFRVHDGNHSWTYWRTALPKVLEFVSTSFHR